MAVVIDGVSRGSVAEDYGFEAGDTLYAIDGHEIMDVLDYRFYQDSEELTVTVIDKNGKRIDVDIQKDEYEELGLTFNTYLMDKKHSCRNACIFCFIDQLPKGMRESLYFKDDDSRLSFLFGNYITLTNITEHEIERIINMHISPVNISVHTTDPELRVKMMKNKNAGDALRHIYRLNDAGIRLNSQLVLCPGYNDGAALEKTLADLSGLENMECIAAVPVGLTKYRDGLTPIEPFDKESSGKVIDTIDKFASVCLEKYGQRRIYASDEFYLTAGRKMPDAEFYGDFLQLENGVGLWALLKSQAFSELENIKGKEIEKRYAIVTGKAAYPLINEIAKKCEERSKRIKCTVYDIKNNFFGERITVAGLITGKDIIEQLSGKISADELLIPASMLRREGDMFLDGTTPDELGSALGVPVKIIECDGAALVNHIIGNGE